MDQPHTPPPRRWSSGRARIRRTDRASLARIARGGVGPGGLRLGLALSGLLVILGLTASLACATLPDGRAYEMVSPADKNGGEINGIGGTVPNNGLPEGGVVQASPDGDSITYLSLLAFPGSTPGSTGAEPLGAPVASQYLSRRKGDGWSTEDITEALNSKTYPSVGSGAPYEAFSSDLSHGLMLNGKPPPVENAPLGGAPARYLNYYVRDNASGRYEAILTQPPVEGPAEFLMRLVGVAADVKHVVVATRAALTPEASQQPEGNLYEWGDGSFQPVNVPVGAAHIGETGGGGALLGGGLDERRAISDDGGRVFWTQEHGSQGRRSLFVRQNIGTPQAETVQVDASREGEDAGGAGIFKTASVDGSKVFFTDRFRLTPGSTADFGLSQREEAHEDLYMFDVETRQLTDITLDATEPGGASVVGVLEASEDGSYVYFVARGALPGTGAIAGGDNLYAWHEGHVRLIGVLSSNDSGHGGSLEPVIAYDWDPFGGLRTANVAPDGQHLLFMSSASMTGYDNTDATTGLPDEEVYLYDFAANTLTCVSCRSDGHRPAGPSGFPGGTPWETIELLGVYQPRTLSASGGRVFFDSEDALVPQDTNGAQDVYEWEQDGSGTCNSGGGCVSLLSGGMSASESAFVDASADGSDAFFVTRAQLVSGDGDQLRDLYDARVAGGFPSAPAQAPCEAEECLSHPAPGASVTPPVSAVFNGPGNALVAPRPASTVRVKHPPKHKKRSRHVRRRARHASGRVSRRVSGGR